MRSTSLRDLCFQLINIELSAVEFRNWQVALYDLCDLRDRSRHSATLLASTTIERSIYFILHLLFPDVEDTR